MIPRLDPITVTPRPLNDRLWFLAEKEIAGTITPSESLELDLICKAAEQDNYRNGEGDGR